MKRFSKGSFPGWTFTLKVFVILKELTLKPGFLTLGLHSILKPVGHDCWEIIENRSVLNNSLINCFTVEHTIEKHWQNIKLYWIIGFLLLVVTTTVQTVISSLPC